MTFESKSIDSIDFRIELSKWYDTSLGCELRDREATYLSRELTPTYKQLILQIGSLGWEDRFLDREFFKNFSVIDRNSSSHTDTRKIFGEIHELPVANESIDVVIMPHTLEFTSNPHQILREVDRVLKCEGRLIFLGFNPWSVYQIYHFMPGKRRTVPWCGHFISRKRIIDWLSLLNFETRITTGFYIKPTNRVSVLFEQRQSTIVAIAYAIKAIKRRYTCIPLNSGWMPKPRFAAGETVLPKLFQK